MPCRWNGERIRAIVMAVGVVVLASAPLGTGALRAQTPPPAGTAPATAALTAAAESITPAELARYVGMIAHDSIGGRATSGPGLERAASLVAAQFRALGLKPGATPYGNDTVEIQAYPLPGQLRGDYDEAGVNFFLELKRGGGTIVNEQGQSVWRVLHLNSMTDSRPACDTAWPNLSGLSGGGVLVVGRHTPATLREAQVHDKFVLYVPPAGLDSTARQQVIEALIASNHAVAVLSDEDSTTFVHRAAAARQRPFWLVNPYMAHTVTHGSGVYVRAGALRDILAILDVDLAKARALVSPVVRRLPSLALLIGVPTDTTTVKPTLAPNVVGILEGADPAADYVVLSAHLDNHGGPGANDNALGVAGLLALANALRRSEVQPRRSIVFLATSGSGEDFSGARYFVHESGWNQERQRARLALNLTLDLLGRGPRDSVHVAGLSDLELPVRVDWLAAAHPELGLTVVDAGTAVTAESDHYAFVEAAVPSLYVSNGTHADPPTGPDTPAQLDLAQAARILKLVFYATEELANAAMKPRWSSEGHRRRIEVFGQ